MSLKDRDLAESLSNPKEIESHVGRVYWMSCYESKGDVLNPYRDLPPVEFQIKPDILREIVSPDGTYPTRKGFQSLLRNHMLVKNQKGQFKKTGARMLMAKFQPTIHVFEREEDAKAFYLASKAESLYSKRDRLESLLLELDEVTEFIDNNVDKSNPGYYYVSRLP